MNRFELLSFPGAAELARSAAEQWLELVEAANRSGKSHYVALSAGRVARTFFEAVVEAVRARNTALAHVSFFWADERCVPPADRESNFKLANECLFQPLRILPGAVHRIKGELPPEQAATLAIREITTHVPSNDSGQPYLDMIFLGMGEDGHVASLFPGEREPERRSALIYRVVTASKPPPIRVTLGYKPIAAAAAVWVLASGLGKAAALRESLSDAANTPLGIALKSRQFTRIFTDIALS